MPREGTLTLTDDDVLGFEAESGRTFRLEASRIRRVKRVRGSPVLQVRYDEEGRRRHAFFYFTSPPPLGNFRLRPGTREDKVGRRKAFAWLEERGSELREDLREWVRAIREASARG